MFIACADAGDSFASIHPGSDTTIYWAAADTWEEITRLCETLRNEEGTWRGYLSFIYELTPGEYGYRHRWEWRGDKGWLEW